EGAWPRAHAQPVEGGESERTVDRLAAMECAEACPAAKVRDDDAAVRDLGGGVRQHCRDVLVRDSVKSVALKPGTAERARQRHHGRDDAAAAMERGVEAGDLRCGGKPRRDRFDRREVMRLVEWRERCERG